VGYSSAYFLSRFPEAHVLAVEPDRNNYELLRHNLGVYGDRVTAINTAVWPCRIGLKVCRREFGKESEWTTTVRECREGEQPDLEAIDIETLLEKSGYDKIDILKVDIEGAEALLFSTNVNGWIGKVRTFAIELHNQECSKVFHRALEPGAFEFSGSGEITIAKRR
jgi:FkbM family methyltransferase